MTRNAEAPAGAPLIPPPTSRERTEAEIATPRDLAEYGHSAEEYLAARDAGLPLPVRATARRPDGSYTGYPTTAGGLKKSSEKLAPT